VSARTGGQIRVVGTGLLGTSIGLGLSALAVDVVLDDVSPSTLALAVDYGAGRRSSATDSPSLVVVAVPPDVVADVVAAELARFPDALVTDVASVKAGPLAALRAAGADTTRYLGSHPMAGRERSGPFAARADLFLGRPWVITPHADSTAEQAGVLEALALDLGGVPVRLPVDRHDDAVAVVSHAPQLVASLLAARLVDAPDHATDLAGQGLRDTTRIAGSDPGLWVQILSANAARVLPVLSDLRDDLDAVVEALADPSAPGAQRALADLLAAGNDGVARIPGKHGVDLRTTTLTVLVDDRPGQIARLLTEIGELGVNLEDMRLEHSPGAPIGIVEVAVLPEVAGGLETDLQARGWRVAG
jgi:prephenate dehydrogenase